ncbi:MAG: PAS domain S-box protein [Armatimonadota bacterium]|nr:PAS domain S-box protein [Armatimonadota bacterium]
MKKPDCRAETSWQSDECLGLFIENVREYAIFTLDGEGRIANWNSGAERIFGYSDAEITGESGSVIFTPEDIARGVPAQELRQAMAAGRAEDERWLVRKDGTRFWASGALTALHNEAGELRCFTKIIRDDTERKRAEEELRGAHNELELRVQQRTEELARLNTQLQASEDRFRAFMDNSPAHVFIKDQQGRYVYLNKATLRFLNTTVSQLLGKTDFDLAPEEIARQFEAEDLQTFACGQPQEFLETLSAPDGSLHQFLTIKFPFQGAGGDQLLAGVAVDVTERKRMEEELKRSQERLAEAERPAHLGSWEWNVQTNTVLWSDELYRIFGLQPQEFTATFEGFLERVHPDDRMRVQERVEQAFRNSHAYDGYCRILRPDGVVRILHTRAALVRDASRKPVRLLGSAQDVTELKQAEAARQELLRRVVTAQEEERRRIARELHDQMGQSLAALLLGLKSLPEPNQFPPAAAQRVRELQEITQQLMQQARQLALDLRPEALDGLGLASAVDRYTQEWSRASGVPVDCHSRGFRKKRLPAPIETTVYRAVQEALTNVLRHAQAQRVSVLLECRPDHILAIVEDDGHGFDVDAVMAAPPAQRRLGLLGMQERVALVHGTLKIESRPGAGTTVFIQIPLTAASQRRAE